MYYVYKHIDDTGKCVYIGKGSGGRAWATTGRKGEHSPFMLNRLNSGNASFVEVSATNLTEDEALELEELCIKEAQPLYNRFFTDEWKQSNKERGLKGAKASSKEVHTPFGIFKSGLEASRELNIPKARLYARIRSTSYNMKDYYYVNA